MTSRAAEAARRPDAGSDVEGWGAIPHNSRYQPAASARLTADQVPS